MPAKAGIQYTAVAAISALTLWDTGSPPSRGRQLWSWLNLNHHALTLVRDGLRNRLECAAVEIVGEDRVPGRMRRELDDHELSRGVDVQVLPVEPLRLEAAGGIVRDPPMIVVRIAKTRREAAGLELFP